jgi:hypothetical protein
LGGKPLFAVLLLSDGANSTGSEPLNVLDDVKKTGVPVYTSALEPTPALQRSRTTSARPRPTPFLPIARR